MTHSLRQYGVAVVGGGSLFALGVREGMLLRHADDVTARRRARQLGTVRTGAAVALLLRPRLWTAALGLVDPPGARLLPRLLAVRELALGIGAASSSRADADHWPWLMTIAAVDGAEAGVLMAALRRHAVNPLGGWAFVAADLGSASAVLMRVAALVRGHCTIAAVAAAPRR